MLPQTPIETRDTPTEARIQCQLKHRYTSIETQPYAIRDGKQRQLKHEFPRKSAELFAFSDSYKIPIHTNYLTTFFEGI